MELNRIKETVRTFSFKFLDESVTVSYRLGAINQADAERITGDEDKDRAFVGRTLERVLVSWSLTDNGEEIKPTAENIEKYAIPMPFLTAVMQYLGEDTDPKRLKTSKTS